MVQMFYYEQRGKGCRTIWKHHGRVLKVDLHVEDSWAETATQSYLLLTRPRWRWRRSNRVNVTEVSGTKRRHGSGHFIDNSGTGTLWIRGAFTDTEGVEGAKNAYFRLSLSSAVSPSDFRLGYCLTGALERSSVKYSPYSVTHLAFVKRMQQQQQQPSPTLDSASSSPPVTKVKKKKLSSRIYDLVASRLLKRVACRRVYVRA